MYVNAWVRPPHILPPNGLFKARPCVTSLLNDLLGSVPAILDPKPA